MKVTIEGSSQEIKELLQAIASSEEQKDSNLVQLSDMTSKLTPKIEKSSKS